jgi:penicillin-binding protein 1C
VRRSHVLALMVLRGAVSADERALAERAPLALRREHPRMRAPHFVEYALATLPAAERAGATVATTLDGPLQRAVEVAVREHLLQVAHLHIQQAAVVVLRNSDGAVLALEGSGDFFDAEHGGAVNGATARRRPGSTLKPFVYGLALEHGDSPATVAFDVVLPEETHERYTSDVRQHGFARYRESLAGSYNLAAVHTIERVGVKNALDRLRAAGLQTLDWPDERYGPELAIGEAEVRLIDLAAAFASFVRGGVPLSPRPVERAVAPGAPPWQPPASAAPRIFAAQIAYLIYDILADPDARKPMFGERVPMELPFPVALKTGTTRAYTDNWALAATREVTVGVWAGNFDGSPTRRTMAMRGAAPLARAVLAAAAARFGPLSAPERPADLTEAEICPVSGMRPGALCPYRKRELFLAGAIPTAPCSWHVRACGRTMVRYPEPLRGWARVHGLLPPPGCDDDDVPATAGLRIVFPQAGARFQLDPFRPARRQVPPLRAVPAGADVTWTVDGVSSERFCPTPGTHVVRAERAGAHDQVTIEFQ